MHKVIISDTSVQILFQKINRLELLQKNYQEIITTPEVADEYGDELPDWISIHHVSDKKYQKLLEIQIDIGEASAIALATEFTDVLLLLDDLKARKIAAKLNLRFTGSLGIIHRLKQATISMSRIFIIVIVLIIISCNQDNVYKSDLKLVKAEFPDSLFIPGKDENIGTDFNNTNLIPLPNFIEIITNCRVCEDIEKLNIEDLEFYYIDTGDNSYLSMEFLAEIPNSSISNLQGYSRGIAILHENNYILYWLELW